VLEIIIAAGWPIYPLIFASVLAIAIIVERLWSLRVEVIAPSGLLDEVKNWIRQGSVDKQAVERLRTASLSGEIFASTLNNVTSSREVIRESIEETGRAVAHKLEKNLTTLGTIATVSPLLGLLGTVIGMVELFGAFNAAGSGHDVAQFAKGISVALYNTAAGIVVAVPAMIFYRYFRGKVDGLVVEIEQQAVSLVEFMHGERK
jgi:biopolymer transport protein ExbB